MGGVRLENFGGRVPIMSRRLLPNNMAVVAANAYLRGGEIRGIREPKFLHSFPGPTVYRKAVRLPDPADPANPIWLAFESRDADFFPNPLVNDAFDRYVYLDNNGHGQPAQLMQNTLARFKVGTPGLKCGVPRPTSVTSLFATGTSSGTLTAFRTWVQTWVNLWGEESAPSDPSNPLLSGNTTTVNVNFLMQPTAGQIADYGITKSRIYRSVSGTQGSEYYLVGEVNIGVTFFADNLNANGNTDSAIVQTKPVLQSAFWREPELMEGIVAMPNGFFAGWNGKSVFFSEPYRPWAWPASYIVSTEYPVLDAGVVGQTLVCLTSNAPALMTGVHPSSISIEKTAYVEPCVEPRSIVQAPEGVYYASQNGLMLISGVGLASITKEIIDRDDWTKNFVPLIKSAAAFDSQYVVHGDNGNGFIFDPRGLQSGVIDILNFERVVNIWSDPFTSDTLLIINNDVYNWSDADQPFAVATWVSKEFQFPRQINLGAVKVSFDPRYATDTPLTIIDENTIPVGGPWTEYSAIVNYNQINGPYVNESPAWGSAPPGNTSPPADAWPFWYGVEQNADNFDLPPGDVCMLVVYARGGVIVFQQLVEGDVVYRLPSGFKSDLWWVEIKTRVPVLNVQMAETVKELNSV